MIYAHCLRFNKTIVRPSSLYIRFPEICPEMRTITPLGTASERYPNSKYPNYSRFPAFKAQQSAKLVRKLKAIPIALTLSCRWQTYMNLSSTTIDIVPADTILAKQHKHSCFRDAIQASASPLRFKLFREPGGAVACICMRCLLTIALRPQPQDITDDLEWAINKDVNLIPITAEVAMNSANPN